jgi:mannose-6-phosphate isomerase-like protein (cupin superfamily)
MEDTMSIEAKPWGSTELLFFDGRSQINRISIVDHGYSSRHLHANKVNVFVVLSGRLVVSTFLIDRHKERLDREVILGSGQSVVIEPGVVHRFLALEPTEAIEAYFSRQGEVKLDDIERFDSNGVVAQVHDHGAHDKASTPSGP